MLKKNSNQRVDKAAGFWYIEKQQEDTLNGYITSIGAVIILGIWATLASMLVPAFQYTLSVLFWFGLFGTIGLYFHRRM
jgi:hypothetical protein